MAETNHLLVLGWIALILILFAMAIYKRARDERTKLRNQVTTGVGLGIWMVIQMFWNPYGFRPTTPVEVWGVRVLFATAAGVVFHLAWTKYWEYREKYPREQLFKRQ